jgi:hypothetical protein
MLVKRLRRSNAARSFEVWRTRVGPADFGPKGGRHCAVLVESNGRPQRSSCSSGGGGVGGGLAETNSRARVRRCGAGVKLPVNLPVNEMVSAFGGALNARHRPRHGLTRGHGTRPRFRKAAEVKKLLRPRQAAWSNGRRGQTAAAIKRGTRPGARARIEGNGGRPAERYDGAADFDRRVTGAEPGGGGRGAGKNQGFDQSSPCDGQARSQTAAGAARMIVRR